MSMPSGSSAVSAAPISEPSSMVPVVSTATETDQRHARRRSRPWRGGRRGSRPWSAAGPGWSRRSARRRRRRSGPRRWPGSRRAAWRTAMWPRVGSLVPGPIEPSTQRWRPSGRRTRRRPRGRCGRRPRTARRRARGCRTRPARSGWRRRCWSRRSRRRRAKYSSCTERTMSGRVTLRISLQPSRSWKSSRVGSCAWSMVPMAPSATTTRVARASRSAVDAGPAVGGRGRRHEAMNVLPGDATAVGFAPSRGQRGRTPAG